MIALFFEVTPRAGQDDRYLQIAASLKPALDASGGIQYLNRFRSLSRPRTLLSHQIWVDEASLARWRAHGQHHGAQCSGRRDVFEDYRLRVGAVGGSLVRAEGVSERAPSVIYNDPKRRAERWMVVVYATAELPGLQGGAETWRSVYNAAECAITLDVEGRAAGLTLLRQLHEDPCVTGAHLVLVSRDYGMFDRAEAPQYFPPVHLA